MNFENVLCLSKQNITGIFKNKSMWLLWLMWMVGAIISIIYGVTWDQAALRLFILFVVVVAVWMVIIGKRRADQRFDPAVGNSWLLWLVEWTDWVAGLKILRVLKIVLGVRKGSMIFTLVYKIYAKHN